MYVACFTAVGCPLAETVYIKINFKKTATPPSMVLSDERSRPCQKHHPGYPHDRRAEGVRPSMKPKLRSSNSSSTRNRLVFPRCRTLLQGTNNPLHCYRASDMHQRPDGALHTAPGTWTRQFSRAPKTTRWLSNSAKTYIFIYMYVRIYPLVYKTTPVLPSGPEIQSQS